MRKRYCHRLAYLSFLVVVFCIAGCKKNVAAAPPAPLPVEPAPAPPPPAPAITLRAAPAAIDRGQSTSLQWEAKNATSVRIQPEVGNVQLQGSRSVAPASSVTYTATATGPGGSASDTARVTVSIPAAVAPALERRMDHHRQTARENSVAENPQPRLWSKALEAPASVAGHVFDCATPGADRVFKCSRYEIRSRVGNNA